MITHHVREAWIRGSTGRSLGLVAKISGKVMVSEGGRVYTWSRGVRVRDFASQFISVNKARWHKLDYSGAGLRNVG